MGDNNFRDNLACWFQTPIEHNPALTKALMLDVSGISKVVAGQSLGNRLSSMLFIAVLHATTAWTRVVFLILRSVPDLRPPTSSGVIKRMLLSSLVLVRRWLT